MLLYCSFYYGDQFLRFRTMAFESKPMCSKTYLNNTTLTVWISVLKISWLVEWYFIVDKPILLLDTSCTYCVIYLYGSNCSWQNGSEINHSFIWFYNYFKFCVFLVVTITLYDHTSKTNNYCKNNKYNFFGHNKTEIYMWKN